MRHHYLVVPNFFEEAEAVRAGFEKHFSNPGHHTLDHQIWNYWYVPEAYTYLRTMPDKILPKDLADRFVQWVNVWAMANLGLSSPHMPFVSVYVNGCGQALHNDALNGQLGWVYSITRWNERNFVGGETILFRPENYWETNRIKTSGAGTAFYDKVPSLFNQLVIFDDRVIHGVEPIHGTMDPMEGRVVIHGHMKAEAAILTGMLKPDLVFKTLAPTMEKVIALAKDAEDFFHGFATVRLMIETSGDVSAMKVLCDRILPLSSDKSRLEPFRQEVKRLLTSVMFPPATGPSEVTLPILIGT